TRTVQLDYLIYFPPGYNDHPTQEYPLLMYLHGAGSRGDDPEKIKAGGIPYNLENGQDLPFIILSPQCPAESHWSLHVHALNALLDEIVAQHRVDEKCLYLTGASLGGAGVWFLAANYPTHFAAIAPLCGRIVPLPLTLLTNLPI
ncbi:MAG: hypothetical protein KDK27_19435, partial [Leptospiraceae bacterium]|nr:hypothetical protein [Leptospiraceae bacterium]